MPGELAERDLQDDFAGTLRRAALLFRFKTFHRQQTSIRTPARSGPTAVTAASRARAPRRRNREYPVRCPARPSAASGQQERPVRRDPASLSKPEVGPKLFAGIESGIGQHSLAVLVFVV